MKALLLSAPSKTTEDLNWSKPLNAYLLSIYGNTSEFQADLSSFNDSRISVQSASETFEIGSSVENCLNYYSQLELLDLRVPISALSKRKSLTFTWSDAFAPDSQHSQSALPYEKACVLFNLGSSLMKAAVSQYNDASKGTSTEQGEDAFKSSIQSMQQAAGVFQYLSENFLHGPSSDLKPPTVKFLSELCLAQAQEMFTLKVIDGDLEQKKNSLIAKLSASAAQYYDSCHSQTSHLVNEDGSSALRENTDSESEETGFDDEQSILGGEDEEPLTEYDPESSESKSTKVSAHLNASWVAIFRVKHLYYRSLAYYFQGLQLDSAKKYGDSIAYLTKSSETLEQISSALLKSVTKSKGHNVYDMLDNLEYQKDALKIKLTDLTKDNDLIYHDIIPSLVTLAEPKAMNSSKVIPMNKIEAFAKINEKNYNQFLNKVVPMNIHELLSFYSEEKSQFLRNELDAVDVSNEELSSALEYLNLPKALVSIKELVQAEYSARNDAEESELSPDVIRKVQEISGKFAQDLHNRNVVSQRRQEIYDCMSRIEILMNSASSGMSYGNSRDDLIKLKRSLYDAANSDAKLFALIDEDNSALYQTLGKGIDSQQFKHLFSLPRENKAGNAMNGEPEISLLDVDDDQLRKLAITSGDRIAELEDSLNNLNVLRAKKSKLVAELKEDIHRDDISDILLINSRIKSPDEIKTLIFPEELKKFEVYSNSLNNFIEQQKSVMNKVKKQWENLISDPKVKKIQSTSAFKNNLLNEQTSKIDLFYEKNWKRYTVGLQKGALFYEQLLDYARGLQNAIERQTQPGAITPAIGSLSLNRNTTGGSFSSQTPQHQPHALAFQGQSKAQHGSSTSWHSSSTSPGPEPQWGSGNFAYSGNASATTNSLQSGHSNAPQLPPKRSSENSISGDLKSSTFTPSYSPAAGMQPGKSTSEFGTAINSALGSAIGSANRNRNESGSGLIYDQPSTYVPNMYDLFAQKRG